MREILFRGKRTDNGEWVQGSLLSFDDDSAAIVPSTSDVYSDYARETLAASKFYDVIPSTVGQYTGLLDQNNVKIFEGDVARYGDDFVAVKWDEEDAMFCAWSMDGTNWRPVFFETYGSELEVVGNIHDNPELLEVQALHGS